MGGQYKRPGVDCWWVWRWLGGERLLRASYVHLIRYAEELANLYRENLENSRIIENFPRGLRGPPGSREDLLIFNCSTLFLGL